MKVSVIGTGYVGLVSGVCLAEKGHQIVCVDIDRDKIEKINHGIPVIYEEGLEKLLKRNLNGNFIASTDLRQAVLESDLTLIAVGTPFDGQEIDLSFIREAARQLGEILRDKPGYHAVVVKSTVVPGTTDEVVGRALEEASGKKAGEEFGLGMSPEFLREGMAIQDFMLPDRIVMGGIDDQTLEMQDELYSVFPQADKVRTSNKTAEMIKYTANALLATMISFSNEIGNLCAALGGIDVVEVMQGVHLDKRLSPILPSGDRIRPLFTTYLEAGCGFGGSCFPKDVKALIAHGRKIGRPMTLLDSVIHINEQQPRQVLNLLQKHFPSLKEVPVAILGLAFKPGTDDMRESPAIPIIQGLLAQKSQIRAYDPVARREAQKLFKGAAIDYCDSLEETLDGARAVVLLTRWEEFGRLPEMLTGRAEAPLFIDGRRMLDKRSIARYEGIGM